MRGDCETATKNTACSNILLVASSDSPVYNELCVEFLTNADPVPSYQLAVVAAGSAANWVAQWEQHGDPYPKLGEIISVVPSETAEPGDLLGSPDSPFIVSEVLDDPDRLGTVMTSHLERWAADAERIQVCVHSLSSLIDATGLEAVVGFLDTVLPRVASVGATAHYHLDPRVHDGEVLDGIEPMFDLTMEVDRHGNREVRS